MAGVRVAFEPRGAVTGIGSLPQRSTEEAIEAVPRWCPAIPFWPQLPQRNAQEGIIAQALGLLGEWIEPRREGFGYVVKDGCIDRVVQGLHRSDGALREEWAGGFFALEESWRDGKLPLAQAVKGQIEGPITLAAYLFYRDKTFLADASLFAAVAFHVSQIVCWQTERLRAMGLPVLLFVDEPALCLRAAPTTEERLLSALSATLEDARARGAWAGLHCCAASPFARMCQVGADVLSFDAHEGLEEFFLNAAAQRFLQGGGLVAYGLIPTRKDLQDAEASAIFRRWLAAAAMAGDPPQLARQALVTATCGLGLLDEAAAEESFALAAEVGAMLAKLAD